MPTALTQNKLASEMRTKIISSDLSHSANLAVLDDTNKTLKVLLIQILSTKCALTRVSRISHRHQLGFKKIVLWQGARSEALRLHIWDNFDRPKEDIHTHCAPFQSRILTGLITENSFRLQEGCDYKSFRYHFDTSQGHSVAVDNGLTGVCELESIIYRAGETYFKSTSQLHSVENIKSGTITISVWGRRENEALVLKPISSSAKDCTAAVGMSPSEVIVSIEETLHRLEP